MNKQEFEFEVLVNGKPVAEYAHEGKTLIEGKDGTEFALRMRNRSGRRALFVPTIDGLSVMDGKEASLDGSGYIVGAYDTETISGWRVTDEKVAKFFFAKVAESYAAKTGQAGNVGVIGCAVFKEKEREPATIVIKEYVYPQYPHCPWGRHHGFCPQWCSQSNMVTAHGSGGLGIGSLNAGFGGLSNAGGLNAGINMQASAAAQQMGSNGAQASFINAVNTSANLGTGFGEAKQEAVRSVSFEREKQAACIFTIHYNTRANLEAAGVQFKKALYASASPFPKGGGYCQPPAGWDDN